MRVSIKRREELPACVSLSTESFSLNQSSKPTGIVAEGIVQPKT